METLHPAISSEPQELRMGWGGKRVGKRRRGRDVFEAFCDSAEACVRQAAGYGRDPTGLSQHLESWLLSTVSARSEIKRRGELLGERHAEASADAVDEVVAAVHRSIRAWGHPVLGPGRTRDGSGFAAWNAATAVIAWAREVFAGVVAAEKARRAGNPALLPESLLAVWSALTGVPQSAKELTGRLGLRPNEVNIVHKRLHRLRRLMGPRIATKTSMGVYRPDLYGDALRAE